MDKTIDAIFNAFQHLARELQAYFLSGFIIACNLAYLDYFYYDQAIWNFAQQKGLVIPAVLLCYIIGHICMAFYYVLLERTGFEKKLRKLFIGEDFKPDTEPEPGIYKENPKLYLHFIERGHILTLMRWNFSAAFLILSICNAAHLYFYHYLGHVALSAVLYLVVSVLLLWLAVYTEYEYSGRTKQISEMQTGKGLY